MGTETSFPEAARRVGHLEGASQGLDGRARQDRRAHRPPVRLPHPRARRALLRIDARALARLHGAAAQFRSKAHAS
jgi:hypothetical protein